MLQVDAFAAFPGPCLQRNHNSIHPSTCEHQLFANQPHRTNYGGLRLAKASSDSTISQAGKILGTAPGRFDSHMIMSPVVRRYVSEEGENWRMWYNGRDSEFDADVLNMVTGRIG